MDTATFPRPNGVVRLSPMREFLPGWGLAPVDEDAVVDAVTASVEENLSRDVRHRGRNGDRDAGASGGFDVEIRTSRDHPDPWGGPHVSRVVVGGTILELGDATVGLADSTDPGNSDREETAVVLLDRLSAPPQEWASLNRYRGPQTDMVQMAGVGVGATVAHELGHLFGLQHTDHTSPGPRDVMDGGGLVEEHTGVGPDRVFGTADDVDVDFGRAPHGRTGVSGVQDTLDTLSFTLATAQPPSVEPPAPEPASAQPPSVEPPPPGPPGGTDPVLAELIARIRAALAPLLRQWWSFGR